jgi:hypothetical protein
MSADKLELFHPDVVEAFASAWASIDGKLDEFGLDKNRHPEDYAHSGTYEGYMEEAQELLARASKRLPNMDLWERLSP